LAPSIGYLAWCNKAISTVKYGIVSDLPGI